MAGLVVYTLHNGKYFPSSYKPFLVQDLSSLILFLKEFKGIILGHNIFAFDYKVLKKECRIENICNQLRGANGGEACPPELNLDGIIQKSVDTLWFACRKKGSRGGLSLKILVRMNLRRAVKGTIGRRFAKYWHHGHRKEAFAYNKNDCVITHKLWWQMSRERELYFQIEADENFRSFSDAKLRVFFRRIERRFRITSSEARYLTGQRKILTYRSWAKKLLDGGILPTNCHGGNYVLYHIEDLREGLAGVRSDQN
ncbi:MAG: hypothetical protein ABIU05_04205 [Nitrospirales bacterium]